MHAIRKDQSHGVRPDPITGPPVGGAYATRLPGRCDEPECRAIGAAAFGDHFAGVFRDARYYRPGTHWKDYEPAYRLAYRTFASHRGRRPPDVEQELASVWTRCRSNSTLGWCEAWEAVRDGWQYIESRSPRQIDVKCRSLYVELVGLLAKRVMKQAERRNSLASTVTSDAHP